MVRPGGGGWWRTTDGRRRSGIQASNGVRISGRISTYSFLWRGILRGRWIQHWRWIRFCIFVRGVFGSVLRAGFGEQGILIGVDWEEGALGERGCGDLSFGNYDFGEYGAFVFERDGTSIVESSHEGMDLRCQRVSGRTTECNGNEGTSEEPFNQKGMKIKEILQLRASRFRKRSYSLH